MVQSSIIHLSHVREVFLSQVWCADRRKLEIHSEFCLREFRLEREKLREIVNQLYNIRPSYITHLRIWVIGLVEVLAKAMLSAHVVWMWRVQQRCIRLHGARRNCSTPLNRWRHSPEMTSHSSVSLPPSESVVNTVAVTISYMYIVNS